MILELVNKRIEVVEQNQYININCIAMYQQQITRNNNFKSVISSNSRK